MNLKQTLIATVAVASALSVAACGNATDAGSGGSGQAAALTKANFASTLSKATSTETSVHVTGTFGAQGKVVKATVDLSFGDQTLTGLAANLSMTLPTVGAIEGRLLDGAVYVNAAKLGLSQSAEKPWIKLDLTGSSSPLAPLFSKLSDNFGPGQLTQTLKGMTTLTMMGTETVDGVSTTHYRATIDTSKLSGTALDPQSLGGAALPKTIGYDVWVDTDNRPVKVSTSTAAFDVDLHFSKWGVPVHVVAPPAAQVQDAPAGLGVSR